MARFCTHCGTELAEGNAFCAKCGAPAGGPPSTARTIQAPTPSPPVDLPAQSPLPASSTPSGYVAAPPPPAQPQKSGNLFLKIVVGVVAFFVLAGVVAIGSCIYIVHRVKNKAEQVEQAYQKGGVDKAHPSSGPNASAGASELAKLLGLGGKGQPAPKPEKLETRPMANCPSKDRTGFDAYVAAAASASVPMKKGLILTDVWQGVKKGDPDIETLNTVANVGSSTILVSAMRLAGNPYPGTRQLCIEDMLNGRDYVTIYGKPVPDAIPGSTMFSLSRAVFQDLKAGHPAAMTFFDAYKSDDGKKMVLRGLKHGTLTRVEPGDVPYSIIVNGERKDLPTIHAKGDPYEAWVLDDEANPLVLKIVNPKTGWNVTYVKITYPVPLKIERDLAQKGRAEIYGIYFDFDSATLRPESGPVLKEIAEALQHNPGWKIKIDGHTDNIGADAYNLQLSQRRAGAVKQALIKEYGIAPDRMMPEGFGASRPKATNDTVEGRALNRRVELVRE
jgi:outer membrane protein OmpA-like peptidoglycan-associated protein